MGTVQEDSTVSLPLRTVLNYWDISAFYLITPRAYAQAGLSNRFCPSSLLSLSVIKKIEISL